LYLKTRGQERTGLISRNELWKFEVSLERVARGFQAVFGVLTPGFFAFSCSEFEAFFAGVV